MIIDDYQKSVSKTTRMNSTDGTAECEIQEKAYGTGRVIRLKKALVKLIR